MRRIKLIIAYDGTNYCGWQTQINGITVEEILNKTLSSFLGEDIAVIGASRTDSGVHALGNVAVFDTNSKIPGDKFSFALNQRLPEDIVIQKSEEVSLGFHPRFCDSRKTYEYSILNRTFPMPLKRLYSYFVYMPLDVEKMQKAAEYLLGEHDFKSFCSARTQVVDTVRTIYELKVWKAEDEQIKVRITGNGFLYNMVRIIVGTLVKVGLGVYPPEHMKEILDACDRNVAGPKAPAQGLTLVNIEYAPDELEAGTDGIIFDIDGTLWDVRHVVYESWKKAVQEHTSLQVNFTAEELGQQFGKTMNEIFQNLFPDATEEDMEKVRAYLYQYEFDDLKRIKPELYPKVEETLQYLSEKYPLYIVTNAQKGYIETLFECTGIQKYFKDWMCYGDTLQPKSVTLQKLIEKNYIERPVYIGDTTGDAIACREAGVPFIFAKYGLGEVNKPKHVIWGMEDLKSYF